MPWFTRRTQSTRDYPTAGASVTADASRFRRAKTTGARRADRKAQDWEDADREQERQRRGRYR
ncbi:hypothetical protein [Streptomyces antibioticus]|uniref:hypothetical protein n=1 Tax=Streptomyces antibioticus TaxID=1890 RepID=UPI0036F9F22B